jgi:hypothetical protein
MSWEEGDFLENWGGARPNPHLPKIASLKKKAAVILEL